ncbi:hypothetical protein MTR_4g027345 [Medicago truncatula]|uniref:Uncharacterized protein n=1 Tax=Medicago truncatula TaxID=3880 RepID=A0A072UHE4_MEDTR|nr:hypothetical protein MTR_4g027345 [Medicago truncatula]
MGMQLCTSDRQNKKPGIYSNKIINFWSFAEHNCGNFIDSTRQKILLAWLTIDDADQVRITWTENQ